MKRILTFWQQDVINKLILLTILFLIVGGFAITYLIVTMPDDSSLSGLVAQLRPVEPTVRIPDTQVPTSTPQATEIIQALVFVSTPTELPLELSTASPTPITQEKTLAPTSQPEALATIAVPAVNDTVDNRCIPEHSPQSGKVLDILDGNTIKVLIGDLVYVVRYIGVAVPEDSIYGSAAKWENSKLTFGKEVTLFTDSSDKDASGHLLRYVMAGDDFVNLHLIAQGLGSATDVAPNSSCAVTFQQAEQMAIQNKLGKWSISSTPASP